MDEVYYCGTQVTFMGVFVAVIFFIIVTMLYAVNYGRPIVVCIEYFLALGFDQLKAVVAQPLVGLGIDEVVVVCLCTQTGDSRRGRVARVE